jgi:hypothetical protein
MLVYIFPISPQKMSKQLQNFKTQNKSLVSESKVPVTSPRGRRDTSETIRKSNTYSAEIELERVTKVLSASLSQLRLADEEIERVWFEKSNMETELMGKLESMEQVISDINRQRNDLAVLLKTKDEWINGIELKLQREISQPDENVLRGELKQALADLAETRKSLHREVSERAKLSDKVLVLNKHLEQARIENEQIAHELSHAKAKLVELTESSRGLAEANMLKTQALSKLDIVSKVKEEQAKKIAHLTHELGQNEMRLRSHFLKHKIPDFKSEREAKQTFALLESQKLETAKFSAEAARLSEELRVIKSSTVDRITSENERLRRKTVEIASLLSEEQEQSSRFKTDAMLLCELQEEVTTMKAKMEEERADFATRESQLKLKLGSANRENSQQKLKLDKLERFKSILSNPSVLSGLNALHNITGSAGENGK